jgi:hypothetical protein
MPLFQKSTYVCVTWFERDRQHVSLQTDRGQTIFDLWDEQVTEAIQDGFLPTPSVPRPTDADWLPCALMYARSFGLIPQEA